MKTGILKSHYINSQLLKKNPIGNPSRRELIVYTPPGYSKKEKLPCIMFLPGFGSYPQKWHNKDFPGHRLLELLIHNEEIPRTILCTVDGMTKLGGSQYVDSSLNGPFASHIVNEIVPFMQKNYHIAEGISICGHSSGGFGALSLASEYPEIFPKVASFAGDLHFELTHKNMLATLINDYRKGALKENLNQFLKSGQFNYSLGLAAAYSPNLRNSKWKVDFPIDFETAEFNDEIWKKWMSYDPCEWIKSRKSQLKKLDLIYLSVGEQDQFALHLGADLFLARCKKNKIKALYESHEGNHSLIIKQLERGFKQLS